MAFILIKSFNCLSNYSYLLHLPDTLAILKQNLKTEKKKLVKTYLKRVRYERPTFGQFYFFKLYLNSLGVSTHLKNTEKKKRRKI